MGWMMYPRPHRQKAGLRAAVRIHDLRHTVAAALLSGGVHPKVASALLRHTRTLTTLELYAHVSPNMAQEAVGHLRGLLPAEAPATPPSGKRGA